MAKKTSKNADFVLPSSLAIDNVKTVIDEISNLNLEKSITVDCSAVGIITTPGIQLLMALSKTISKNKAKLKIVNVSSVLYETLCLAGLEHLLQEWE